MSYNYYPVRRRHIDRCAYMVRHNDGLNEIGDAIVKKCKQFIRFFARLSGGRKISYILGSIVQVVSGIFVAKDALDVKEKAKRLSNLSNELESHFYELQQSNPIGYAAAGESGRHEEFQNRISADKKWIFIKGGIKALCGLLGVLSGQLIKQYAVSK